MKWTAQNSSRSLRIRSLADGFLKGGFCGVIFWGGFGRGCFLQVFYLSSSIFVSMGFVFPWSCSCLIVKFRCFPKSANSKSLDQNRGLHFPSWTNPREKEPCFVTAKKTCWKHVSTLGGNEEPHALRSPVKAPNCKPGLSFSVEEKNESEGSRLTLSVGGAFAVGWSQIAS